MAAAVELVGVGRNRRSGDDFARGKAEKRENEMGNVFRDFGWGAGAGERRTMARHGTVVTESDCACEETGKRRRESRRQCLPPCEAPAALARRWKAAE
jgi:hypothetical protein